MERDDKLGKSRKGMHTRPSADGDKALAAGISLEAISFARLVTKFLAAPGISNIYIKDARFGNFDDFDIRARNNLLHCCQAKESRDSNFTFNFDYFKTLVKGAWESKPIIMKAFEGLECRFYIITDKSPSQSKARNQIPKNYASMKKKKSFLEFIIQDWEPYQKGNKPLSELTGNSWLMEMIEELQPAAVTPALSGDTLAKDTLVSFDAGMAFLRTVTFLYDQKMAERIDSNEKIKLEPFTSWFTKHKVDDGFAGEVSIMAFLEELKILVTPNPHEFPVDANHYLHIPDVKKDIITRLSTMEKGYFFIQGPPGAGKSTFIQMELQPSIPPSWIVFKYLCFARVGEFTGRTRGDARTFWEDMNAMFFDRTGAHFGPGTSPQDAFREYLDQVALNLRSNAKCIIFLDGIDHISREQLQPDIVPLYQALPIKEDLPNGVIFVVSGQHFHNIQWFRETDAELYQLNPFNQGQLRQLISLYFPDMVDKASEVVEKLFSVTNGNPLYASVILNQYTTSAELVTAINQGMTKFLKYETGWADLLNRYWTSFDFHKDGKYAMTAALIGNIDSPIHLDCLENLGETHYVSEIIKNFDFLFHKFGNIRVFTHNQFKRFLATRETLLTDSSNLHPVSDIFSRLIDASKKGKSPWGAWPVIRYCNSVDNFDACYPWDRNVFLDQWFAGRPVDDIIEDLCILIKHFATEKDPLNTFKAIFLKVGFETMKANLDQAEFPYSAELDKRANWVYVIQILLGEKWNLDYNAHVVSAVLSSTMDNHKKVIYMANILQTILDDDLKSYLVHYIRENALNLLDISSHYHKEELHYHALWIYILLKLHPFPEFPISRYLSIIQKDLCEEKTDHYDFGASLSKLVDVSNYLRQENVNPDLFFKKVEAILLLVAECFPNVTEFAGVSTPQVALMNFLFLKSIMNHLDCITPFIEGHGQFANLKRVFENVAPVKPRLKLILSPNNFGMDDLKQYLNSDRDRRGLLDYLLGSSFFDRAFTFMKILEIGKISVDNMLDEFKLRDPRRRAWEKEILDFLYYLNGDDEQSLKRSIKHLLERFTKKEYFFPQNETPIVPGVLLGGIRIIGLIITALTEKIELHTWFLKRLFTFMQDKAYLYADPAFCCEIALKLSAYKLGSDLLVSQLIFNIISDILTNFSRFNHDLGKAHVVLMQCTRCIQELEGSGIDCGEIRRRIEILLRETCMHLHSSHDHQGFWIPRFIAGISKVLEVQDAIHDTLKRNLHFNVTKSDDSETEYAEKEFQKQMLKIPMQTDAPILDQNSIELAKKSPEDVINAYLKASQEEQNSIIQVLEAKYTPDQVQALASHLIKSKIDRFSRVSRLIGFSFLHLQDAFLKNQLLGKLHIPLQEFDPHFNGDLDDWSEVYFTIDPEKAREWCWNMIKTRIGERREPIISYSYGKTMPLFFSSLITKENAGQFLDLFMKYQSWIFPEVLVS